MSGFGQSLYKVFPNHPESPLSLESRPKGPTNSGRDPWVSLFRFSPEHPKSEKGVGSGPGKPHHRGMYCLSEDKGVRSQEDGTSCCLLPPFQALPYKNSPLVTWGHVSHLSEDPIYQRLLWSKSLVKVSKMLPIPWWNQPLCTREARGMSPKPWPHIPCSSNSSPT